MLDCVFYFIVMICVSLAFFWLRRLDRRMDSAERAIWRIMEDFYPEDYARLSAYRKH